MDSMNPLQFSFFQFLAEARFSWANLNKSIHSKNRKIAEEATASRRFCLFCPELRSGSIQQNIDKKQELGDGFDESAPVLFFPSFQPKLDLARLTQTEQIYSQQKQENRRRSDSFQEILSFLPRAQVGFSFAEYKKIKKTE